MKQINPDAGNEQKRSSFLERCVFFGIAGSIGLLALAAAALFFISCLPFALVEAKVNSFAADGKVDFINLQFYTKLVLRARLAALSAAALCGFVAAYRRRIQRFIAQALSCFAADTKVFLNDCRVTLMESDKVHCLFLFIIMLLAVGVRLLYINLPMRCDEALTYSRYASPPLWIGLSLYNATNNHVFHTLLVHIVTALFGNQPWIIRLPALPAGFLVVPALYFMIRSLYNKHAALLAAGLAASSSFLIEFSVNARGYTLICLFFIVLLLLARYLMRHNNAAAWVIFVIVSVLGAYTIPIMIYPFGSVITWIAVSMVFKDEHQLPARVLLKNVCIALIFTGILTLLVYAPVFIASGFNAVTHPSIAVERSFRNLGAGRWLAHFRLWDYWNRDVPGFLRFLFFAGCGLCVVAHRRVSSTRVPAIAAAIVWCVGFYLSHRVIMFKRTWLFLLPLYLGTAACGIWYALHLVFKRLGNRRHAIFSTAAVLLTCFLIFNVIRSRSVYYSNETGGFRDAERVTFFLKDYLRQGDKVYAWSPCDSTLEYYFNVWGVPHYYLEANDARNGRAFVVIQRNFQTIDMVLSTPSLTGFNPKLIKQFETAKVYEIER